MHDFGRSDHLRTEKLPYALVAQAHAQDRDPVAELPDGSQANPGMLWATGSGGDDDAVWRSSFQI